VTGFQPRINPVSGLVLNSIQERDKVWQALPWKDIGNKCKANYKAPYQDSGYPLGVFRVPAEAFGGRVRTF
jgi:hypothetical protein